MERFFDWYIEPVENPVYRSTPKKNTCAFMTDAITGVVLLLHRARPGTLARTQLMEENTQTLLDLSDRQATFEFELKPGLQVTCGMMSKANHDWGCSFRFVHGKCCAFYSPPPTHHLPSSCP